MMVADRLQEDEDDHHDERERDHEREFHVLDRGPDRRGPIDHGVDLDGGRHRRHDLRERRLDVRHGADDVGPRLLVDLEQNARLAVLPGRARLILGAVDGAADVADAHRPAIVVRDDHVVPRGRPGDLVVVVDRKVALDAVEGALGGIDRGVRDHRRDILESEAQGGELGGLDLHPHGGLALTSERHQPHAGDLRDLLGEDIVREVGHLGDRERVGMGGKDQDRRVGRIDLPVVRRARKILRQLAGRSRDRGLDVLRRPVDIAIEIELDRDRGAAERARRGHLGDARDLGELPLQRSRDRGRHRLGTGAGKRSRDLDRRKVDLRQRRDREHRVRDHASEEDRQHDQRGTDRVLDEGGRDAHCGAP